MNATYKLDLQKASSGYDRETCWVHARVASVPRAGDNGQPLAVMTTQKLVLGHSDSFLNMHSLTSGDGGVTWTKPAEQKKVARKTLDNGQDHVVGDMTPGWHRASRTLLATGHDVYYVGNKVVYKRPRHCAYMTYDLNSMSWNAPKVMRMPEGQTFYNAGGGSTQRWDLDDGRILLPIYFKPDLDKRLFGVAVVLCEFDGSEMRYVAHGNELYSDEARGFVEPSVAGFGGRFFMTIRHDLAGYVASSDDGLNYSDPVQWTFDNGEPLGNYNTQQHWAVHQDGLFLVYTRKGLNNDHVFRHRAPIVMAQVDPEKLCVIRETEKVIVPQRGARLGNFSVHAHTPDQTWICVAEWMQALRPREGDCLDCEAHGSDNTIWVARVNWDTPNTAVTFD